MTFSNDKNKKEFLFRFKKLGIKRWKNSKEFSIYFFKEVINFVNKVAEI